MPKWKKELNNVTFIFAYIDKIIYLLNWPNH